MNHEYVEPRFMHPGAQGQPLGVIGTYLVDGKRPADEVLKEINAHGVSVTRIRRDEQGRWTVVTDPRNRRITGRTAMEFAGPARGCDHRQDEIQPRRHGVRGTLNNCAHGVTPWNTYLTAEENWAVYFRNNDSATESPTSRASTPVIEIQRGRSRYPAGSWPAATTISIRASMPRPRAQTATDDFRNEPNAFGWMVEIDPFQPDSEPVKRTALGRFAHEGVVFAPAVEGRPLVCYSGDDAMFQFIYKFVSAKPYRARPMPAAICSTRARSMSRGSTMTAPANGCALVLGQNGLTPENGFADQADVLVNTRARRRPCRRDQMDRPEWGAVDPNTGMVYFTLTNNPKRGPDDSQTRPIRARPTISAISSAGPRRAATMPRTRFRWDLFLIAGDAEAGRDMAGRPLDDTTSSPAPTACGSTRTAGCGSRPTSARRSRTRACTRFSATTPCSAPIRRPARSGAF